MIENACATQAIINCLLNRSDVDVGPELAAFREFTIGLPPEVFRTTQLISSLAQVNPVR